MTGHVAFIVNCSTKLRRLCFYTCLSFCSQGVLSQHALQVVSQHALQQVSRGVSAQGGFCSGGAYSGGGVLLRGVPARGGSALGGVCSRGVETPQSGQLAYCCGRYASYWNAFLLNLRFTA